MGSVEGKGTGSDFLVTSVDPETGASEWEIRHNHPSDKGTMGFPLVALGPSEETLYVHGLNVKPVHELWFAVDVATQQVLWNLRVPGQPYVTGLEVTEDGSMLIGHGTDGGYWLRGVDTATGENAWESRYSAKHPWPPYSGHRLRDAETSSDGSTVVATGSSNGDVATVAFDAQTGDREWTLRYASDGIAGGLSLALSGEDRVFVGGWDNHGENLLWEPHRHKPSDALVIGYEMRDVLLPAEAR